MYASTSIIGRVIGVIRLDTPTVRSITRDPASTRQAASVVAVVALAVAIGSVDPGAGLVPLLAVAGLAVWGLRSGHAARMMAAVIAVVALASALGGVDPGASLVPLLVLAGLAVWGVRSGHLAEVIDTLHRGHGTARAERVMADRMRQIRAAGPLASIPVAAIVVAAVAVLGVVFFWMIGELLLPILAWLIFSGVAFYAGAHVFGEPTTRAEFAPILRLAGFALAPGVLAIFNVIPLVGDLAMLVAIVWGLVAVTFAIRQTMMFGTLRAVLTATTSALVTLASCGLLVAIFG